MDKITLPAKLENLEPMLDLIDEKAKAMGFDAKQLNHIKLAAEEVIVNVMHYAYPDKSGDVELTLTAKDDKGLEIEVADWGIPFDPLSLATPNVCAPMEERKIGGLGVFLLRKVMDEVRYIRQDNRNILTFVKYK